MEQSWFEMGEVKRKKFDTTVWIPLHAVHQVEKIGEYGYCGFREEFFGCGTVAISLNERHKAEELGWGDVGISYEHQPRIENGKYIPSDIFSDYRKCKGINLVLVQFINNLEVKEWHLNQDFVLALGLKREEDVWVCPSEGYIEVVRLKRKQNKEPYLIEVRAEHLKDYLCARKMALYITSYRLRHIVSNKIDSISWDTHFLRQKENGDRWEGSVVEIHEGGHPFGSKTAVFFSARNDVDKEEDVPIFGLPTDANVTSESWTQKFQGEKLFRIQGELWRNEWVEPAKYSPRIKEDKLPPTVYFIADTIGNRENRETLKKGGRWLWFSPNVMMALAHRRGGFLNWYTAETGNVGCIPDYNIHFGINRIGLINVYAKDIALLPDWQQQIWAGYNVSPEGGVSEELLKSQMEASPANTQAPEPFLEKGLNSLKELSIQKLGFSIICDHDFIPEIISKCHRFRSVDKAGLYALAKDIARLTADAINTKDIQTIISPPKSEKWGSLKSLEKLIATKIDPTKARKITGALVGVYELRHADAHLPSNQINEALALLRIDSSLPFVHQGHQLLNACILSIYAIREVLELWDTL
jgi:hypothetical protein